jgi:hypothetical protein
MTFRYGPYRLQLDAKQIAQLWDQLPSRIAVAIDQRLSRKDVPLDARMTVAQAEMHQLARALRDSITV